MSGRESVLSKLSERWDKAVASLRQSSTTPEKREYTLMLVPHQGESVMRLRIPMKAVKVSVAAVCVMAVAAAGLAINYRHTVNVANAERSELTHLREVTDRQYAQLEQLAKKTSELQSDISRLNLLDAEIRRMVDAEDTQASRSGSNRTNRFNGQGGPEASPNLEQLGSLVNELETTVRLREKSLIELKSKVAQHNAKMAVTPSIWPTEGDVTSRFGWRYSPFGYGNDWHPGIEIANSYGTPINATAAGQVVMSGWYGGYGKCIQIDHGNGIITLYGHNSENVVAVGETVKKGELIAYMGSTGASTGSHVHYEVRVNGTAVNPANFL